MGIAPFTHQTTVSLVETRTSLRPLLQRGDLEGAAHHLRIIRDNVPDQMTHALLKTIAVLLRGDETEVRTHMEHAPSCENDEQCATYAYLLVDTAICLALNRGIPAVIQMALNEAVHGLTHSEEAVAIQAVQILVQLNEDLVDMARFNHRVTTRAWSHTSNKVVLQWKLVLNLALYRATGDPIIREEILASPAVEPDTRKQVREQERTFRAKAWLNRRPTWFQRGARLVLKKH